MLKLKSSYLRKHKGPHRRSLQRESEIRFKDKSGTGVSILILVRIWIEIISNVLNKGKAYSIVLGL